jgi:hypothetical protein
MSSTNTTAALALTSLHSAFHDLTAARNQVLHAQQDLAGARATRTAQLPKSTRGNHTRVHTGHTNHNRLLRQFNQPVTQAVGSARCSTERPARHPSRAE